MHYNHSSHPITDSANHVARRIREQLTAGDTVLWLLSGGSGTTIAIEAAKQLQDAPNLKSLTISLTDERYGELGHAEENWQQLLDLGFSLPGARTYRPLRGSDRLSTKEAFDTWIKKQLAASTYRIGIFGIGTDGHTAGIKPDSDATSAGGTSVLFKGDDFERLTITYQTIAKLHEAVIQASGENKKEVLEHLVNKTASLSAMPAQILHKVPVTTLYSDVVLDV